MIQQITSGRAVAAMLRAISVALFTMAGVATGLAGPVEDCNQRADIDLQLKGCTAVIQGERKVADLSIIYSNRGAALANKGSLDLAIADYDQAIRLKPGYANAYFNRGIAWLAKGDRDRAIADYGEAIKLKPDDADYYYNRGIAWSAKGDRDRAIADYDQAIRLDPKDSEFYLNRGNAWSAKGDKDRAVADYDQAVLFNPKYGTAYFNRGIARLLAGQPERAIADFDEAAKLLPKTRAVHFNRGRTQFALADFAAASDSFSRAIELGHRYSVLWRFFTRARLKQDGAAEIAISSASSKDRDWPVPIIEFYHGKLPLEQLRAAADTPEKLCEMNFYVAEWHIGRGEAAKAKPLLEAAMADDCGRTSSEYLAAVVELKRLAP